MVISLKFFLLFSSRAFEDLKSHSTQYSWILFITLLVWITSTNFHRTTFWRFDERRVLVSSYYRVLFIIRNWPLCLDNEHVSGDFDWQLFKEFFRFQYFFSSKASESVIATIKERILSRVLHRNAEYFDNPETSAATIVNDLNQQPNALLAVSIQNVENQKKINCKWYQGLDGRAVLFTWCTTCITTCNVAALVICWPMGIICQFLFYYLL